MLKSFRNQMMLSLNALKLRRIVMATAKKCDSCKIRKEIEKSTEPACCIWYMDNVVLGNKNVNDCEIYQEDTEK